MYSLNAILNRFDYLRDKMYIKQRNRTNCLNIGSSYQCKVLNTTVQYTQ
jgi:hypothetical protein